MAILVQKGRMAITSLDSESDVSFEDFFDEDIVCPITPLGSTNAGSMWLAMRRRIPVHASTDTKLTRSAAYVVIILIGDNLSGNKLLQKFQVVKAQAQAQKRFLLLCLACNCHNVNLSNHDQLGCLDLETKHRSGEAQASTKDPNSNGNAAGKKPKPKLVTVLGTLVRGANLCQLGTNWSKLRDALDVFIERRLRVRNVRTHPLTDEENDTILINMQRNITMLEDFNLLQKGVYKIQYEGEWDANDVRTAPCLLLNRIGYSDWSLDDGEITVLVDVPEDQEVVTLPNI